MNKPYTTPNAQPSDPNLFRIKNFRVPILVFLQFMCGQNSLPMYVTLPQLKLPDGYYVIGSSIDHYSRTICITIWHHSFPVVPVGERPEEINASDLVVWNTYELKDGADPCAVRE